VPLLDDNLAAVARAYRTCEFATLAKDGTPITWPTSPWIADGKLIVTTSLGFPRKAFNVRRDNRVALLFSDPTGSGLDAPPQVFVTGTADCPDEIVTSPGELSAFWAMLFERQPSCRAYLSPLMRSMADWYFMRLIITVTPGSVTTRPPVAFAPRNAPGTSVVDSFDSAVLGVRDSAGMPVLTRVRPEPTENGYRVDSSLSGPASLLVHRHDEQLANLRMLLVRGELSDGTFIPSHTIDPAGSTLGTLRQCRRSTRNYLKRRGWARPRIDWPAFRALAADLRKAP
jgi:hypothetical protein